MPGKLFAAIGEESGDLTRLASDQKMDAEYGSREINNLVFSEFFQRMAEQKSKWSREGKKKSVD